MRFFTALAGNKMTGEQIKNKLQLQTTTRHVLDWLDVLASLGFLTREGLFTDAVYSNSPDAEIFLDRNKPSYTGGILEMANNRLYEHWGSLEEALKTGKPQNETKGNLVDEKGFSVLYESPERLQEFMDAMSGIQAGNFMMLAKKFDFGKYKTLSDIGGADASLSIQLCQNFPQLQCTSFDMPQVEPVAKKKIARFGLTDRIKTVSGDFMTDQFPPADVITMGNILHGMNEEDKQRTVDKIFGSLHDKGVFIAIENIIDDNRKENVFGLLMSLNMLIENGDAFDYTPSDFKRWTKKAGFSRTEFIPLTGPAMAAVAYK
jgi:hypothetical protein